jgi:hypothetical protein
MAHFLASNDKYPDLTYDDDYRSYLVTRRDSPGGHRFGRTHRKRAYVRARSAFRRVNGYFRTMIEAIASSKLHRMERELELRGIRFDRSHCSAEPAAQLRARADGYSVRKALSTSQITRLALPTTIRRGGIARTAPRIQPASGQ